MRKKRQHTRTILLLILLCGLFLYDVLQEKEEEQNEEKTEVTCFITHVADGDTLTAQCSGTKMRVRLMAIDAPEYDYDVPANIQPFARQSRDALRKMCLNRQAQIFIYKTDQYGRSVADVSCNGVDVSEAQLEAGLAWVYDHYASERQHFYNLQAKAQEQKKGLWSLSDAIAPWQWRRSYKN